MTAKKINLWAHQRDAIEKFALKDAAGIWFDVGTGKTATAIHLLRKFYNKNKAPLPVIIFTPRITLTNWENEVALHAPRASQYVKILTGSIAGRIQSLSEAGKYIFVTNYEALDDGKFVAAIEKKKFEILILDEAHRIKNPKSRTRAAKMRKFSRSVKYKIHLTGTPILNNPMDIWSLMDALKPGLLPPNYYTFLRQWCYNEDASKPWFSFPKWAMTDEKKRELMRVISPYVMVVKKEDALDLPPLVKTKIYVEMTPEQKRHYKELERDLITYCKSDACVVSNAVSKLTRLQQISNGLLPLTTSEDSKTQLIDHDKKDAIRELIKDIAPDHKIIIWANWQSSQDELCRIAEESGFGFCSLTGRDNDQQREKSIKDFNENESIRILIGSQAAGGIGINLVAASYMIYYAKSNRLEHDIQSEGRAYRGGSERHKKITRIDIITKGTVDEIIDLGLENKFTDSQLIQMIKEKYV